MIYKSTFCFANEVYWNKINVFIIREDEGESFIVHDLFRFIEKKCFQLVLLLTYDDVPCLGRREDSGCSFSVFPHDQFHTRYLLSDRHLTNTSHLFSLTTHFVHPPEDISVDPLS